MRGAHIGMRKIAIFLREEKHSKGTKYTHTISKVMRIFCKKLEGFSSYDNPASFSPRVQLLL